MEQNKNHCENCPHCEFSRNANKLFKPLFADFSRKINMFLDDAHLYNDDRLQMARLAHGRLAILSFAAYLKVWSYSKPEGRDSINMGKDEEDIIDDLCLLFDRFSELWKITKKTGDASELFEYCVAFEEMIKNRNLDGEV